MLRFRRTDNPNEVTITTETFVRAISLVVATFVLILAIHRAAHALLLIFVAFFLALALNAPVNWLAHRLPGRRRGSRSLATSLSFVIVILLLGGFFASIVPPLVKQTQSFLAAAPNLVRNVQDQNSEYSKIVRHYHLENEVASFSKQLSARTQNFGGSAFSTAHRITSSVFSLLTILVFTFMMLVEGPAWLAFSKQLIPKKRRPQATRLVRDMYRVIKGYVNGQVTLAAIAASLLLPALLILHVSYPIALMVIVFICGLIPMVGHTIGAIIVTIVALFHSPTSALIILGYYILYQQIENYLIQPKIQANSTNMSPLLVFMSVIVGVSFSGLLGGLVAIPIAGCMRIAMLEYLEVKNVIDTDELNRDIDSTKAKA